MGQKTNPNIFQLGKTKDWASKFIEKKPLDASKYFFKDLELKKFINKFFADNELLVHNCKIFYTENSISIFLSYVANDEISKLTTTHIIKNKLKKPDKIFIFKNKKLVSNFFKKLTKNKKEFFKIKNYSNKHNKVYEKKVLKLKKARVLNKKKIKTFDFILKNNFLKKLFLNINFFLKKPKIILNFYQLNTLAIKNYTKTQIKFVIRNLGRLRYFNESSFIEKGLQIITTTLKHSNSVNFLAKYIIKELQKHKRQHFFLNFILKAFKIFNNPEFCTPKNIRIQIKGRFNRSSRSRKRILNIGKPMSIIQLDSKIYYADETSFSSNGTFGVKIWILEENLNKNNEINTRTKKAQI